MLHKKNEPVRVTGSLFFKFPRPPFKGGENPPSPLSKGVKDGITMQILRKNGQVHVIIYYMYIIGTGMMRDWFEKPRETGRH